MKIKLSMIQQYAFFGLAFIALEIALVTYADRPIAEFMQKVEARHPAYIDFFRFYTDLGKGYIYLIPSAIGAAFFFLLSTGKRLSSLKRNKLVRYAQAFSFIFVCLAASGTLTDLEKFLVGRARPVLLFQDGYYGFDPFTYTSIHNSMPSGHTTTAFAFAFAMAMLFPKFTKWFLAYGFLLALSRIMVSAHFLADVVAGCFVAFITVFSIHALFGRLGWYFPGRQIGESLPEAVNERVNKNPKPRA